MRKIAIAIMSVVMAICLSAPAFGVEPPRDRNDDRREPDFGRVAVFDSITKVNDWISTIKVTYLPMAEQSEVVAVSGLTEYMSLVPGEKPAKLDPSTLKKGDWVFVSAIFGAPEGEEKPGKQFARMVVKPDIRLLVGGIKAREMTGTVQSIDGKNVTILPYGPHPEDKKPEPRTFLVSSNNIVFRADEERNITQLRLSDVKAGSKVVVSIMPLVKMGEEKKEADLYAVMFRILDNFPEMPREQMMAIFDSIDGSVMKVMVPMKGKPGEGREPNPRPNDEGEEPTPPERERGPKLVEIKFDKNTKFVLNTGDEITPIDPADIRNEDKLVITAQLREDNDVWYLFAHTVRVMMEFPNPRATREMRVFGVLENLVQYSITFMPHKGENPVTLAVDPDCVYMKMAEGEGKRPTRISSSDLKPGDKLSISLLAQRPEGRPGPGEGERPNADDPQRLNGTVFMIAVVDEFPKPVVMGKISEVTTDKLIIEPMQAPGREKDDKKKTMEFAINASTKFFTVSREGRKEAKIGDFKKNDWVMVEFDEMEKSLTAFTIVKMDRPPEPPKDNPNPPRP